MFLLNEILLFAPGRRREALDRLTYIHELMASQPGFQKALVGRYLGDGTAHCVLRFWTDEQAYRTFREGPDGNYGRGRPPGLYANEPVVPQWNSYLDSSASGGGGGYLVKVHHDVPEAAWETFGEHQQRLETHQRAVGGLTEHHVLRARDGGQSLVVSRYRERADWERLRDSAAYPMLLEDMYMHVRHLSTQCFEVVGEVQPS